MTARVGLFEHFGRLFDFAGREDRASFWPYAAMVYGMATVVSVVAMLLFMRSFLGDGGVFSSDSKPQIPDFAGFVAAIVVMTAGLIFLYAAAVVRRLRDSGLSGWWGVMPLPFLIFSMVRMRGFFTDFGRNPLDMEFFQLILVSNLLYVVTLIALIVMLSRASAPRASLLRENVPRER